LLGIVQIFGSLEDAMLVDLFLPAVLTTIMFSLGLGLRVADFSRFIRTPKVFGLGAFNQVILLPIV
jgi:BASS family bile acid:Na+ symporter